MFSLSWIILILAVFICPLTLIILLCWFLRLTIIKIRDQIIKHRQWHSTPCPSCIYFTNNQELRCAVNPCQVLTKDAVNCRDFEPIVGCKIYEYKLGDRHKQ